MDNSGRLLEGKDWERINRKAGVDIMDIVINLDGRYSKSQQMDLISKRCTLTAKAQAKKLLLSISKKTKKLDKTIYLVPDYSKFREALKEFGIEG